MFGLPGQTMRHWQTTLDRALSLRPEHFSLYSLIIEEGTPFYTWTREGRITPGDEDLCADMYEYADERLQAEGYINYEISNWALPGHESRHNLTYWRNLPYLGLGAGAHSYFAGKRFSNERDPQRYIDILKHQQLPIVESLQVMSTAVFQFPIDETGIPNKDNVRVEVKGVATCKISTAAEDLRSAAAAFLGKEPEEIESMVKNILTGHLRSIIGKMTIDEILSD